MPGWMAVLLGLVYAGCVLGTLLLYMVWVYERRNHPEDALPDDAVPVRPWRAVLTVFLETLALCVLVLSWPLRIVHDIWPVRARVGGITPVVLVHGYGASSASMLFLQWSLRLRGWPAVFAISYTPPTANARGLARQVADKAQHIRRRCNAEKVHLVCHSMGGVLTRYALINVGLAGRVGHCVTLGSPHRGSRVAGLVPAMGSAAQMRHDCAFVREVAADGDTPGEARFWSVWSEFDNFVLPVRSSLITGNGENLHVPYHGHCMLLYSPAVVSLVDQCLRRELEPADVNP